MALLRWSFIDLIQVILGCVNNHFDVIIFIEGARGLGKSTLAYKISRRLKTLGLKFNPNTNIAYSREDVIRLLAKNTRAVIFADEMINVAYNRDFYNQDQKILLKALNMYRDSENVFIGCIPRFIELDKQMQRLCKIKITIVRRGVAIIQTQMKGIYREDPWDIKNNLKAEEKFKKRTTPFGKLSTVRGVLRFSDLKEEQKALYLRIKKEKRNQVFSSTTDEELSPTAKIVNGLYDRLLKRNLIQEEFNAICDVSKTNQNYLRKKLNAKFKENGKSMRVQHYIRESKQKRDEKMKKITKRIADKKKITISNSVDNDGGNGKVSQPKRSDYRSVEEEAVGWEGF